MNSHPLTTKTPDSGAASQGAKVDPVQPAGVAIDHDREFDGCPDDPSVVARGGGGADALDDPDSRTLTPSG